MAMHHDAPTVVAQQCGLVERLREGTFGSDITKTDAYLNGLMREAATALEAQAAELAAATRRAERAEAKLAEARKAQNYLNDAVFAGLDHLEIARRAKILVNAARRALEAQGGENGQEPD